MADDFEVTDVHWNILQIHLFAYQTGATTDPSTITGVYLQIWDGPPNDPASSIVWGDLTTNRLLSSSWSGIFRALDTTSGAVNRPIMRNVVEVDVTLQRGTYWLDWMTDGTLASGPWAPPITINGQTTTGNQLKTLLFPGPLFQLIEDISFSFFSKSVERFHQAVLRGLLQRIERPDAEIVVQRFHSLRSEARNPEQFRESLRNFLAMLFERGGRPGLNDLLDLSREVSADSRQFCQILSLTKHRADLTREITECACRIAIGADAEWVRSFDLE